MHDAVALEALGVPTAVIITTAFTREARAQRTALGAEHLEPVVITHPLSTLSDEQIEARAAEAAGQVSAVLTR